jgi:cobyric acid synthase
LIAEGGGNCLLGGNLEFSNRWPAIEFDFSIILVAEGRDGGGVTSLLGLKQAMPSNLQKLIKGFVINGVIERNDAIEKIIKDISVKTQWPCLGILPWFSFENNNSYELWQSTLENQILKHAQPLINLL